MMSNSIPERQVPPFSKLLGILHPEFMIPDQDSLRVAVDAAVDCGLLNAADRQMALSPLIDVCRFAAPESTDPAVRRIRFSRESIHSEAICLLWEDSLQPVEDDDAPAFDSSRFAECLGVIPPEVNLRIKCAIARPGLAPIVTTTAANHLVAAVLDLAARVPGARVAANGDVVWEYLASEAETSAALAWLALPGPGVFATDELQGVAR